MKDSRPTISTTCAHCQTLFSKDRRERQRQERKGRTEFYCSLSCNAKRNNKSGHPNRIASAIKNLNDMRSDGKDRKRDSLSPFRYYVKMARGRKHECTLTPEYLKLLWENQAGLCVYSGVELYLNRAGQTGNDPRFLASIDRIDSTEGYIEGNVQFVSTCLNYAKCYLTDEQFRHFLDIIRKTS